MDILLNDGSSGVALASLTPPMSPKLQPEDLKVLFPGTSDVVEVAGLPDEIAGTTAAPTVPVPDASSGLEWHRMDLLELVELAELDYAPGFRGEADLEQGVDRIVPLAMPYQMPLATSVRPVQETEALTVNLSIFLPGPLPHDTGTSGASSPGTLQEEFEKRVMCNFTPRRPNQLPMAQWVSYKELLRLFEPHAEVRKLGPGNLKQLIAVWYKDDPAFAGLEISKWCKKLTDHDPLVPPRSQVYKFSFEYTPGGVPPPGQASRKRGLQWPEWPMWRLTSHKGAGFGS